MLDNLSRLCLLLCMPLSKARMRLRKQLDRGTVKPSPTTAFMLLPLDERKEVLKSIALHSIEKPISAGHVIAAIKEYNLMEHVYDPVTPNWIDNRTINFIVTSDKAKTLTENVERRLEALQGVTSPIEDDDSPKLLKEGEDDGQERTSQVKDAEDA